jgi:acetate kinase
VFAVEPSGELARKIKGQMDGIGARARLRVSGEDGAGIVDRAYGADEVPDVAAALQVAAAWLREELDVHPTAIGHRVVHGGPDYDRPVLVDADVLSRLERLTPLAPLHQPHNLAPMRSVLVRFPDLPQVACFDTAFHRGHAAIVDHYALPERFYAQGVRRYGFHGLSYEYVAGRLPQVAPAIASGRVIVAHLGSGASMCALAGGRSVESTMGFTALDGLPMGTRPGQIDPGVLLYLMEQEGMNAAAIQKLCYHDCGLKGLSGISNDVRELEASATRGPTLRSTISAIGSDFTPACWPRRWAAWMPSCSRPASARTRPACAHALPQGWPGSAPCSIRPPMSRAPR